MWVGFVTFGTKLHSTLYWWVHCRYHGMCMANREGFSRHYDNVFDLPSLLALFLSTSDPYWHIGCPWLSNLDRLSEAAPMWLSPCCQRLGNNSKLSVHRLQWTLQNPLMPVIGIMLSIEILSQIIQPLYGVECTLEVLLISWGLGSIVE